MKGLQLAGLRPLKYDFSESTVMGSTSQVLHLHPPPYLSLTSMPAKHLHEHPHLPTLT